jgi:hypothetical protein
MKSYWPITMWNVPNPYLYQEGVLVRGGVISTSCLAIYAYSKYFKTLCNEHSSIDKMKIVPTALALERDSWARRPQFLKAVGDAVQT